MGGAAASRFVVLQLLIVFDAIKKPASCWLAKVTALLAIPCLFAPFDRMFGVGPMSADIDKAGALIICFLVVRAAVPATVRDRSARRLARALRGSERPTPWQHAQFMMRILRSDLANFSLLQHRGADALLVTGKNSGTHWLKFMLSCMLAKQYEIPRPRHTTGSSARSIISDPRYPRLHPNTPRIVPSHTIPSAVFAWPCFAWFLPHPPVVVLVRDIPAAMASHYVKWWQQSDHPIAHFVRGDPSGRRYKADLWWYIRFFNRWGDLARANPSKVLVLRYEELQSDPEACLRRIAAHWRLEINDAAFAEGASFAARDIIRSLLDPTDTEIAVPPDGASASVFYSRIDTAFMRSVMARYLRHDLDYGYSVRSRRRWRRPLPASGMHAHRMQRAGAPAKDHATFAAVTGSRFRPGNV